MFRMWSVLYVYSLTSLIFLPDGTTGASFPLSETMKSILYSLGEVFRSVKLHAVVDCVWNVMAHAQKPDFVFRWKGRVHLTRQGRQFSRLLAVDVCASAVVMLDTSCSEVVWRVLATYSIRHFPLHFPSYASQCAITFQTQSTTLNITEKKNMINSHAQDKPALPNF